MRILLHVVNLKLYFFQDVTKSVGTNTSVHSPSQGCWWSKLLQGSLLLCLLVAPGYLAYRKLLSPDPMGPRRHPDGTGLEGLFEAKLSAVEALFPSQRAELWKRSRIHLKRHLVAAQPTEPVSMILTSGRGAERTLRCLARHMASAFSSALNASVLHINGASKAAQDSDQVKLDIDGELRGAFEGDKPAAVIHRFEELPPGSTLIFYRYCDHENAAYKHVFLAFTVLLEGEELGAELSLKEVEEMVQDYIAKRFVSTDIPTSFNGMDVDKLSGLWSRISHLILPVVKEESLEAQACEEGA